MDDKTNNLTEKDPAVARVQAKVILPPEDTDEDRPQCWYADEPMSSTEALIPVQDGPSQSPDDIPWFVHSLVYPPTDPLTIQLLALVDGLPSIPGPRTVGPEKYSQIFGAFMKRGWAGFEEEFDRIVPRVRPDYADVKRDLLREPIFSIEAHRNMADAVLGRKTVDEIFDQMPPREEQEPQ